MTTLPPPVDALDFGGRRALACALLETVGDVEGDAVRLRGVLAWLRHHGAVQGHLRVVVDAAFHLAVWVSLHPEAREPLRHVAATSSPLSDHADVLAAVPAEAVGPLASLAAAATQLDADGARSVEQQLTFLADHLTTVDRAPALLQHLALLVGLSVSHPPIMKEL